MGRHSPAALPLRIPVGWDAMWSGIRMFDSDGPWTVSAVASWSGAHIASVRDFVRRLVAGGIASALDGGMYRLKESPKETPRLRRDGSKAPPCKQQQMWVAMRALARFSTAELAMAASTDDAKVDEVAAQSYIVRLHAAGYLAVVTPAKRRIGGRAIWRLKPSMNTGPRAPQVMRTRFVWDPNREAVMGGPAAAEEVSS
jgi:hypothetical protein